MPVIVEVMFVTFVMIFSFFAVFLLVFLIALMFIGRLGPLLLATSLIGQYERIHYAYPEEPVNIG